MKVNLAAQAFSSSVADAIDYCREVLKIPQFQGSEATVKFLCIFDHLFDILNSRNPLAKGYKSPLRVSNKSSWDPFLDEAYQYIHGLRNPDGQPMHKTRRKTEFLGFLVGIQSIKGIFQALVEANNAPLKYLLTYKLSQDHLVLFLELYEQLEDLTIIQQPNNSLRHTSVFSCEAISKGAKETVRRETPLTFLALLLTPAK